MQIAKIITDKILKDHVFCLELALYLANKNMPVKQLTIEKQAERSSDKLLHPLYIEFYKSKGLTDAEIIDEQPA